MSALSTPGGGGTTAQSKPASGKQKYQKLDINSLYCANRNENSEPSSVKSQLSRKHGMQSLGKVPSARRPPANLPSLKTETGQDSNTNSISTSTTVTTPATCTSQTTTTATSSGIVAGTGPGGWVSLPPPTSPHFRTEFPSLEAAAQPSHRSSEHGTPQPQLRPQTEGSWTCGGTAGVRQESASAAAPVTTPGTQQTPAFRAILPSFLMKGSTGGGLGLGTLGLREGRSPASAAPRPAPRPPATPRAVEVLTARPILRDDQISSLDDISRDAGWAQHDDIDYDQKLDFSDGESSGPNKAGNKSSNRASIEHDRAESKIHEPGDEEQIWAERRQKQNNEVAQAVARARQRKEEEQRKQMRESVNYPTKESRERSERERDRNDNRERDTDMREKDRIESREKDRIDNRDRDRMDNREKERNDHREKDSRDKSDIRERDRAENRDRFDNRDRDIRDRERDRDRLDNRDRVRADNRERQEGDKERDLRDRDRNDNRDRIDRERFDRDRSDRDRDFRDKDRDYGREREQNNPAFSKTFQANIPPRFLKQQQNRQQDDQHKGWAFTGKSAPRRQEPPPYNAPRHPPHNGGRRSYSRDYSDREDEVRREKEGPGPQWRSEMQDYDRSSKELDRTGSKDPYKDDFKERRSDSDRRSVESNVDQTSSRTAADKLTEVFERRSIGISESSDSTAQISHKERKTSPPSNQSQRESVERDFGKTSWAEVMQDDSANYTVLKSPSDNLSTCKETEQSNKNAAQKTELNKDEAKRGSSSQASLQPTVSQSSSDNNISLVQTKSNFHSQQSHNSSSNITSQNSLTISQPSPCITESTAKSFNQELIKPISQIEQPGLQLQKQQSSEQGLQLTNKPITSQKSEKELSESESIASKSSTDPTGLTIKKTNEALSVESLHSVPDIQKQQEDKRNDRFNNEQPNKTPNKEPIERKSSGSGSEKKGRGYGGGSGYAVYNRGWGPREPRGRRSHRSSRSNNRASESDASTDGAPNTERKERRRAPRSPRGPKKPDRSDDASRSSGATEQVPPEIDSVENREPFAPRGQPSRRGRGGFHGTSRPPAPAKRVTGYGPPNTKSPFSQANRAVKENEDVKDSIPTDEKGKPNKPRTGSTSGRGRERRAKGVGGPLSGEEENWETTSEHSEGGAGRRRSVGSRQPNQSQKAQSGRNQNANGRNQNSVRNNQGSKKDSASDNKTTEISEAMNELKIASSKKEDDIVDDGFQEVRNRKNSKENRGPTKEEAQNVIKPPRSHSNQGSGRNGSSSRNPSDKGNARGSAPVPGKSGPQYERPRQANLAPRFVKQRQKQQMGLVSSLGPDTSTAPPPPVVNAWDKPISQTLRSGMEDPVEVPENKSGQASQRSTPGEAPAETKTAPPATCAIASDKTGVLDGTTPPVETIIFENTNYKTAPPAEALKQKYQPSATTAKPQGEEITTDVEARQIPFNGDVRSRPRSIQELIGDNGRPVADADSSLSLQMSFETTQKTEDSSDMKLDFAFDSDLGQLTDDKTAKTLGLPRGTHINTSNTLAADLNLKIASVKKVWEMPAVAEGSEELPFTGFEETNAETGAPPNVCKVKPTQQLQSPPPQHYNHVGYQGGYGGLSVPSPPAVLFNSSQQLLGSSQQLPQQGGLYGAFLDQSRGQFGGFPGTPYGAGSAAPYNYQPPPDMFQSLPNQYRMAAAAAGGGAAFGQSGQLGNSPSTVLISSSSNSLMSATVKPSSQQIGAIGTKGGGVGGVGGVGSVNTYQQQYLGYSGPVGEGYSLAGLLPRPAPPASSYYSPYQPPQAPAPTYPLQFTPPAQSGAFGSQFLSSQLQVAAAVQQMQQQYRAPMQQQYAPAPPRPPPQQQLKSPLHEHANGFAPLCEAASPSPKPPNKPKPPHSPPHHKYQHPPQHPPPAHTPHAPPHHQQMVGGGNNGRCNVGGGGGGVGRGLSSRYPAPIQRPLAPAPPLYRAPPQPPQPPQPRLHHPPHPRHMYYQHHQRNGGGAPERAGEGVEVSVAAEEAGEPAPSEPLPAPAEVKAD